MIFWPGGRQIIGPLLVTCLWHVCAKMRKYRQNCIEERIGISHCCIREYKDMSNQLKRDRIGLKDSSALQSLNSSWTRNTMLEPRTASSGSLKRVQIKGLQLREVEGLPGASLFAVSA
jgi:hypothetical protein